MTVRVLSAVLALITSLGFACTTSGEETQVASTVTTAETTASTIRTPTPKATATVPESPMPTNTPQPSATPRPTQVPTTAPMPAPSATLTPSPTTTASPSPTTTPTPSAPAVTIGGTTFLVEIADTPELRGKGLGERDGLAEQTGMLFIFQSGKASAFWMKGMRFPLDFVWIGADCAVVDLTEGVQHSPPNTPNSELALLESSSPAAYTFEINAGEISRFGIDIGDEVRFHSVESASANCCESGACDGNR